MTQLYSRLPLLLINSRFLFLVIFIFGFSATYGQTYYVNLSGAAEVPPNNSAGTGKALITINGNLMRVQLTFSGLTGNTTASHIHAPTATASTGTAGVATTTPTFTDFPLGVKAGTYDHTFDMTQASSYNPSYITANGGTATSAFAALKAAISAGKSYLNVHSTFAPGGEIRGFLMPCPSIMVSIPNAWAMASGVLPNTVYPAYGPASSLLLQATVSGGMAPYSYNWSNGATTASTTVMPTASTTYSAMVTDQNGCTGTASKMINVVDISGGKKGQNINICHNGHTIAIATPAVADHISHGDMLGNCTGMDQSITAREVNTKLLADQLYVTAQSNPSPNYFDLHLAGKAGSTMQLSVYDLQGRRVEWRSSLQSGQTLRVGERYTPGVYLVQVTQGSHMQTLRLIKAQ